MRDGNSGRNAEHFVGDGVVHMEEKSDDVKVGERATSTDRLSCDVLDRLAGIETHNVVFLSIQALNENLYGQRWDLPNRISMFVIKLSGRVEKQFAKGCDSLPSHLLIFVFHNLAKKS